MKPYLIALAFALWLALAAAESVPMLSGFQPGIESCSQGDTCGC